MHKLQSLGICGNYHRLIHSFLSDRHQRVVLNGQSSIWSHIKAGVPQSSILGLLRFEFISMIYLKVSQVVNFLQMIPHFFQWFMILQHLQHFFLMMTYWKFLVGLTSGRWYLTQIPHNMLKRLFSRAKQMQVTVYFNNVPVIRENIQ